MMEESSVKRYVGNNLKNKNQKSIYNGKNNLYIPTYR